MASTTTSTLDDLFTSIVREAIFTAQESSLVRNLVTTYDISGDDGKAIQVPVYPEVSAAGLTEGTDMSSTAVSTTSLTRLPQTLYPSVAEVSHPCSTMEGKNNARSSEGSEDEARLSTYPGAPRLNQARREGSARRVLCCCVYSSTSSCNALRHPEWCLLPV